MMIVSIALNDSVLFQGPWPLFCVNCIMIWPLCNGHLCKNMTERKACKYGEHRSVGLVLFLEKDNKQF